MWSLPVLIGRGLDLKGRRRRSGRRSGKQSVKGSVPKGEVQYGVLRVRRHRPSQLSGGDGREDPPVPIPNTEVKLSHADNSWLATAREDR